MPKPVATTAGEDVCKGRKKVAERERERERREGGGMEEAGIESTLGERERDGRRERGGRERWRELHVYYTSHDCVGIDDFFCYVTNYFRLSG